MLQLLFYADKMIIQQCFYFFSTRTKCKQSMYQNIYILHMSNHQLKKKKKSTKIDSKNKYKIFKQVKIKQYISSLFVDNVSIPIQKHEQKKNNGPITKMENYGINDKFP